MVHRGIGSARITYPTGVKVSPADPMTSANMPRELLAVPGVVSRPIRLGALVTAPQLIQQYLARAGGDPLQAAAAAKSDREKDPNNTVLRDAEHALFSQYVLHTLGPVAGRAVVATAVPLYSAAKAIGQPIGFFKGATAPSWREVQYGLRPLVAPISAPAITGYMTVGTWPGAVLATAAQCQAYLAAHGGGGTCQAVYSDGSLGPAIQPPAVPAAFHTWMGVNPAAPGIVPTRIPGPAPKSFAQHTRLRGIGYYPNLGQDTGAAVSYMPASLSGIPTWVWWVGAGGLLALLVGGLFVGRKARRVPRVRTVTRTTY